MATLITILMLPVIIPLMIISHAARTVTAIFDIVARLASKLNKTIIDTVEEATRC